MIGSVRVLVVEDERKLAALLVRGLRGRGHVADLAESGEQALASARMSSYDAITLDVMLPDVDGFQTCARLRQEEIWSPVIMLTARDAIADRVRGLDVGADDYLVKPFSFSALLARLRALARRGAMPRPPVLRVGDLVLDPAAHRVSLADDELELSPTEFRLLEAFMRNPGLVLTRTTLLERAWDDGCDIRSNVVDVHVAHLRGKIGSDSLETVRGGGYRLRAG